MERGNSLDVKGEIAFLCHLQAVEVAQKMGENNDEKGITDACDLLLTLCRAFGAVCG